MGSYESSCPVLPLEKSRCITARVTSTAGWATLSSAGSAESLGNAEEDVIYPRCSTCCRAVCFLHNYLLLAFGLPTCEQEAQTPGHLQLWLCVSRHRGMEMWPQPWKTWICQELEKSFSKLTLGLNILLLAKAIPQINSSLEKKLIQ